MEATFWLVFAAASIIMWKAVSWLVCAFAVKLSQLSSAHGRPSSADAMVGLKSQLAQQMKENRDMQDEIWKLQSELKGCRAKTRLCTGPTATVYLTSSGTHFHTHADCGHIKNRGYKEFQACAACCKAVASKTL